MEKLINFIIFEKKIMRLKNSLFLILFFLVVTSCQTRVVHPNQAIKENTLELYEKYTIQTMDAKIQKVQVIRIDNENIYAKSKTNENIVIKKNDIREVKKFNLLGTIGVIAGAIAAFILIPV